MAQDNDRERPTTRINSILTIIAHPAWDHTGKVITVLAAVFGGLGWLYHIYHPSAQANASLVVNDSPGATVVTNLPDDPDPKAKLGKMAIPYTDKGFEDALISGNLDVLSLFFEAGYSPNHVSSNTDNFSSTLTMRNNDNNFKDVLALMRKNGLNYKVVNYANKLTDRWPLGRPLDQEEELYYMAAIGSSDKIPALVDEGADPTSLLTGLLEQMEKSPSRDITEIITPLKRGLAGTKYAT